MKTINLYVSKQNKNISNNNWESALKYATTDDFKNLLNAMYQVVEKSKYQYQTRRIAQEWIGRINEKQSKALKIQWFLEQLEIIQPSLSYFKNLSTIEKSFINTLFEMPSTQKIIYDKSNNEIIAIVKPATSEMIFMYGKIYMDLLSKVDCDFSFMVNGEGEKHEEHYNVIITKEEWHAFNR
ncbi:MAG: hypothetical protein LBC71_08005 [Oscillospiraceae bacterium]|nr:hypothetical protein [Oscillospiraceae bacterium]